MLHIATLLLYWYQQLTAVQSDPRLETGPRREWYHESLLPYSWIDWPVRSCPAPRPPVCVWGVYSVRVCVRYVWGVCVECEPTSSESSPPSWRCVPHFSFRNLTKSAALRPRSYYTQQQHVNSVCMHKVWHSHLGHLCWSWGRTW